MKPTSKLLLASLTTCLLLFSGSLWAAPKKARKVARPEVYAAVDAESVPFSQAPEVEESQPAPAQPPRVTTAPPRKAPAYDTVPSEHRESIARRLSLVAQLILAHGRAYDYRTATLAELQKELNDLAAKSEAPAPAAPAMPAAAQSQPAADESSDGEGV